jgi:subtilisin family serine protease
MSFGYSYPSKVISEAIKYAHDRGVLLMAAAGNSGSTEDVRYPARDRHVMCIHAATALGNMYDGNPTRKANASNFAILGVAVQGVGIAPARQAVSLVRRSGTSQATAVAAGVAALIIQIMRESRAEVLKGGWSSQRYESALSQLKTLDGMLRVFEKISEQRDGYDVVLPWLLVKGLHPLGSRDVARHICGEIMRLMEHFVEDF